MTVEEKRNELMTYCHSHHLCTFGEEHACPLYGKLKCWDTEDEQIIEENFALVSAMPDYRGEQETINDDNVNHPSHYTQGGIECIDAMTAAFGKDAVRHFCICNAFKYIWRSEHKNGSEDLEKAKWYINKYNELKESV